MLYSVTGKRTAPTTDLVIPYSELQEGDYVATMT